MAPVGRSAWTVREVFDHLAHRQSWARLSRWPPDVFAVTAALLADSGAYRVVVSPPAGRTWPPSPHWKDDVRLWAGEWVAYAESFLARGRGRMPKRLRALGRTVWRGMDVPVDGIEANRALSNALLTLHAMADEACAGMGITTESSKGVLDFQAKLLLVSAGSLSRLPPERVRVLPKVRAPEVGVTVRSLSRHLALVRSEVAPAWRVSLTQQYRERRFTLLLVPWPYTVDSSDFSPFEGTPVGMDVESEGFFQFAPSRSFNPRSVVPLIEATRSWVDRIDAVVLPEAALTGAEVQALAEVLRERQVRFLIAGVREPAPPGGFGQNFAYLGQVPGTPGSPMHEWQQHKHHRWQLDAGQVRQYDLGSVLDPTRRWWEAIRIRRRELTFILANDWLTICPLICEDLARPDPVADVIRAVGPTLVVALLLDGPQLARRWAGRHASGLSDDPGCSILTLTSLGMALRSRPSGAPPCRKIALWKERKGSVQEIELAEGANAVLLTCWRESRAAATADGRLEPGRTSDLILGGYEQVA